MIPFRKENCTVSIFFPIIFKYDFELYLKEFERY